MKNTNKIGLLAAVGISMSLACIVVRTDMASATGSIDSTHMHGFHGWSSRYGDWSNESENEDGTGFHHYHDSNDCSCNSQDDSGEVAGDSDDVQNGDSTTDDSETPADSDMCDDSDTGSTDEDSGDTSGDPQTNPGQDGDTAGDQDQGHDGEDTPADGSNDTPDDSNDDPSQTLGGLELAIDQQVSVGGGEFKPADTEEASVPASVGDDIVWKVIVSPVTVPVGEDRTVKVDWMPPANVEVISTDPSKGVYDGSVWTVTIAELPAELIVHTKLKQPGTTEAVATIGKISCIANGAAAFCDFEDPIVENNSNPSVISAQTDTTEPTAPATGGESASGGNGVLGASTGGRGGEGVMLVKGDGPAQGQGGVLAATTSGSGNLANTGSNAYVLVLVGVLLSSAPVGLAALTATKRSV